MNDELKEKKKQKSFKEKCMDCVKRKREYKSREIILNGEKAEGKFPPNLLRNQKFNLLTFVPLVLYEQFKFFFNLYFLIVALTQFIPALQVGKQNKKKEKYE